MGTQKLKRQQATNVALHFQRDLEARLRVADKRTAWRRALEAHRWGTPKLSGLIIYEIIRPRLIDADRAPSLPTVAADLGRHLKPDGDEREVVQLGAPLLWIAHEVGLIESTKQRKLVKGDRRQDAPRIELTDKAELCFAELVNRYVVPELPARPSDRLPVIRRNWYGTETPGPLTKPVIDACKRIEETPWRVNTVMLDVIRNRLTRTQLLQLESDRKLERVYKRWQTYAIRQAINHVDEHANRAFYLPIYLDFRGRVYQDGGTLQWTSGAKEIGRTLLEFADPPELTEQGRGELGYYLATLYGQADQLELGNGEPWLHENRWVLDLWPDPSPAHPELRRLGSIKKRLQFLAGANALIRAEAGHPCALPIALDASCSGLQHLALLARDIDVAKLVNLRASDRRQDFYGTIAFAVGEKDRDLVKKALVPWLYGAGVEKSGLALARAESRKVSTYGYACGCQTEHKCPSHRRTKRRAVRGCERCVRQNVCDDHLARATRIQASARAHAVGAYGVFEWLQQAVGRFNRVDGLPARPIWWTAPTGLRLVQDYRRMNSHPLPFYIPGEERARHTTWLSPSQAIDQGQQVNSFGANFVHSLDAAYLVTLINRPEVDAVRHWAVAHDAFGVSPNAVSRLRDASKGALLELYSSDVLRGLRDELSAQLEADGLTLPELDHESVLPAELVTDLEMTTEFAWMDGPGVDSFPISAG